MSPTCSASRPPDANVLGTFMERLEVAAGTVIVRQDEAGDALYLIATGEAEVRVTNHGRSVGARWPGSGQASISARSRW